MLKTKLFFVVFIAVIAASCSKSSQSSQASLYIPTSSDVTAKATLQELQDGRALYINNCGKCHDLFSPDDYSASRWKTIMSGMAPKTNMSASQVTLVTKYVTRGQ
jgi:hypothetical protein